MKLINKIKIKLINITYLVFLGVSSIKSSGKFVASIKYNGIRKNLGTYDTPEQAHKSYMIAKKEVHCEQA